jgi:hypothetical protein
MYVGIFPVVFIIVDRKRNIGRPEIWYNKEACILYSQETVVTSAGFSAAVAEVPDGIPLKQGCQSVVRIPTLVRQPLFTVTRTVRKNLRLEK